MERAFSLSGTINRRQDLPDQTRELTIALPLPFAHSLVARRPYGLILGVFFERSMPTGGLLPFVVAGNGLNRWAVY